MQRVVSMMLRTTIFLLLVLPLGVFAQTGTQEYKVKQGETLYGLSQKYGTTVSHLLDLNPAVVDNKLQEGATIKVPVVKNDVNYNKVKIGPPQFLSPVTYNVSKGETLYSISKKMNTNVESLRMWNDLKSDAIKAGQKLVVGYGDNASSTVTPEQTKSTPTVGNKKETEVKKTNKDVVKTEKETSKENKNTVLPNDDTLVKKQSNTTVTPVSNLNAENKTDSYASVDVKKNPITATTTTSVIKNPDPTNPTTVTPKTVTPTKTNSTDKPLVYLNEKGVITWTKSNNDDGQFYALHPTAPIGTTITVKNMMNSKSIQVKVIGKLPNTADNQNVLMKISNSAAKALNVLDDKFLATANYMGYKQE